MAEHTVTVEVFYSGSWNDHTSDVYARDPVSITRGRSDEQQQTGPSRANFTLDNRQGQSNPDNPTSPLFGLVGRNTPVRIDVDGQRRFTGEVASLTPEHSSDNVDAWVKVQAAGILRRLGANRPPLRDPLYRHLERVVVDRVAWWALDGGDLSTAGQLTAGSGGEFAPISGNIKFGTQELAPWLAPGVTMDANSTMAASVQMTQSPEDLSVLHVRRAEGGGSGPSVLVFGEADVGNQWIITFTPDPFNEVEVQLVHDGSFVGVWGPTAVPQLFTDGLHAVQFDAFGLPDVDQIAWELWVDGQMVLNDFAFSTPLTGVSRIESSYNPGADEVPLAQGHWVVRQNVLSREPFVEAAFGHPGEPAGERFFRLCQEEGVDVSIPFLTGAAMGPQRPETLLALLRECVAADQGIMSEQRAVIGLTYRRPESLYVAATPLALDYDQHQVAPPLIPTTDDQQTRNEVTASRVGGGQAKVVVEEGPLSILPPPAGVGRYEHTADVNVASDQQLPNIAGWLAHLGTWPGARVPVVRVDLDASPELAGDVEFLDPGDRVTIDNLPARITPNQIEMLVQGWTETVQTHRRVIELNTSPAGPWQVGRVESSFEPAGPADPRRYDTAGSETVSEFEAGADTQVNVIVTLGPTWTTAPADVPFDIAASGVRLRVTAVVDGIMRQHMTVDQEPVNGVRKWIPAGSPVTLWQPGYYGL